MTDFETQYRWDFNLFETTLMSIQRNICFVQEQVIEQVFVFICYVILFFFFYIVIIKKYSVQICLICLTEVWSSLVWCVLQIANAVYIMLFLCNYIIQKILLFQLDILMKNESYLMHSHFQARWPKIDFVIKHKCIHEFSTRIELLCICNT